MLYLGSLTSPHLTHLNSIVGVERLNPGCVLFRFRRITSGLNLPSVISTPPNPAEGEQAQHHSRVVIPGSAVVKPRPDQPDGESPAEADSFRPEEVSHALLDHRPFPAGAGGGHDDKGFIHLPYIFLEDRGYGPPFFENLSDGFPVEHRNITLDLVQGIEDDGFHSGAQGAGKEIDEFGIIADMDADGPEPLFLQPGSEDRTVPFQQGTGDTEIFFREDHDLEVVR